MGNTEIERAVSCVELLGPNWNSYGAEPPSPEALATARELIVTVHGDGGAATRAHSQPYAVAPLVNGGVQVEWRGSGGSIEVEIGPHGELGFFLERPEGAGPPASEGDGVSRAKILRLVQSVLAPATRQQKMLVGRFRVEG